MTARLQVMKFGGTSLGDASCISRTAQIIAQGSSESNISFVLEEKAMKTALITARREFGLGAAAN